MIQNKNISNKFGGCFLLSVLLLVMILQFNLVSADMQVIEYNITSGGQDNAQFQVPAGYKVTNLDQMFKMPGQ